MLGEESSPTVQSGSGGYAYFTNGVYDSRFTSYKYYVVNAPANVCGTLHIVRSTPSCYACPEATPGWICTNSIGEGSKGPWTGSTNQTGQSIYIQWPNGTTTVGADYKVDDGSDPDISISQTGGFGVPIPNHFNGSAWDVPWGTGFKFGSGGWSSIRATFRNATTFKYYNGTGYNSTSAVTFYGTSSPPAGGYNISWAVTPPPQSVHNSYDTYEWCVQTNDRFYDSPFRCIFFYGPR